MGLYTYKTHLYAITTPSYLTLLFYTKIFIKPTHTHTHRGELEKMGKVNKKLIGDVGELSLKVCITII
jgi:hypothetical protein